MGLIVPPAIVFVNNDLTPAVQNWLENQLHIDETMDGYTFDQYITADPDYSTSVRLDNRRIMVIRDFRETTNRTEADVVLFISHGLAKVEYNKFGPPGQTYKVLNLHWGQLNIYGV